MTAPKNPSRLAADAAEAIRGLYEALNRAHSALSPIAYKGSED